MSAENPPVTVCSLDGPSAGNAPDFLIDDGNCPPDALSAQGVVLPGQDEARARQWLEAGAQRVYLGEAALLDGELVGRLAARYGGEHIGIYVPAGRIEVSWSLETVSNADFRVVTPSHCQPAWEILRADGSRTGTLAGWWLEAMFERGAAAAIVRVDIGDDADLNLCATLAEAHGERLCFAPWQAGVNDFIEWTTWGKVTRLAVPVADLAGSAALQFLAAAAPDAVLQAAA